jgi:hypothetical protein
VKAYSLGKSRHPRWLTGGVDKHKTLLQIASVADPARLHSSAAKVFDKV